MNTTIIHGTCPQCGEAMECGELCLDCLDVADFRQTSHASLILGAIARVAVIMTIFLTALLVLASMSRADEFTDAIERLEKAPAVKKSLQEVVVVRRTAQVYDVLDAAMRKPIVIKDFPTHYEAAQWAEANGYAVKRSKDICGCTGPFNCVCDMARGCACENCVGFLPPQKTAAAKRVCICTDPSTCTCPAADCVCVPCSSCSWCEGVRPGEYSLWVGKRQIGYLRRDQYYEMIGEDFTPAVCPVAQPAQVRPWYQTPVANCAGGM